MSRSRGFSMAELILVITVGVVLLASGTILFNHGRFAVGSSRAQQKVLALQSIVERLASRAGGTYPDIYQVAQLWVEERPDFNKSPWGGRINTGFDTALAMARTDGNPKIAGCSSAKPFDIYCGINGQGGSPQTFVAGYGDREPGQYDTEPGGDAINPFVVEGDHDTDPQDRFNIEGLVEYRRIRTGGPSGAATASVKDYSTETQDTYSFYVISIRGTIAPRPGERYEVPMFLVGGPPVHSR